MIISASMNPGNELGCPCHAIVSILVIVVALPPIFFRAQS